MKVLAIVANPEEERAARRILAKAGIESAEVLVIFGAPLESKPTMKELRELKPEIDATIIEAGQADYIIAMGDTAARLVLDTSTVNISRIRGRDYEYAFGVRGKVPKLPKPEHGPRPDDRRD